MFLHPSTYLAALAFAVAVYWAIPAAQYRFRAIFLTVFSLSLIGMMQATLVVVLLLSAGLCMTYAWLRRRFGSIWLAGLFVALQILLMVLPDLAGLADPGRVLVTVGLTYFTLRNIGFVIDTYKQKNAAGWLDILFLNGFFPIYSAGPIENAKTFAARSCQTAFRADQALIGLARILVGITMFYFLSNDIVEPFIAGHLPQGAEAIAAAPAAQVLALAVLGWIALYLSFSGYAHIAIGSSSLFGLTVRENFRAPFLATDLQDYWQRWNISVMNFVSEYLYLNFVRVTGLRITGLFLVFLVIGMWHRVSVNYLFWGLAHASAMAALVILRRRAGYQHWRQWVQRNRLDWPVRLVGWVCTMLFVCVISAIGTAGTPAEGLAILSALTGAGR